MDLIQPVTMATGGWDGSVRVYEEDDKVDEKLLNQLSKWILYNRLPWLARNLVSLMLKFPVSSYKISVRRTDLPGKSLSMICFF